MLFYRLTLSCPASGGSSVELFDTFREASHAAGSYLCLNPGLVVTLKTVTADSRIKAVSA